MAPDNVRGLAPVGDDGGAVRAGHVEPGHADEVRGSDLHARDQVIIKEHIQLEAVIHQLIGDMVAVAEDLPQRFVVHDAHDLVDEVNAPVQDHAAAMLRRAAPVTGNAPGSVYTGLHAVHLPQITAVINVAHEQEFAVPAAVLVNREQSVVLVGCIKHFLQIGRGKRHGLVHIVGHRDGHKIHRRVAQQRLERRVRVDPVFLRRLAAFRLDVIDAHQIHDITVPQIFAVP